MKTNFYRWKSFLLFDLDGKRYGVDGECFEVCPSNNIDKFVFKEDIKIARFILEVCGQGI